MRIATWNVNSLRARLPRVEQWIATSEPDVLCLQETKCADDSFPVEAFTALGYESAHHGDGRWNGVAIVSRIGLEDVQAGFADAGGDSGDECRLIAATCGGVRVLSVYVPNGRVVGSEHYVAKLEWLARLRRELASGADPAGALAVCGDFNVAPSDDDVWDIGHFDGATHVTVPEREAVAALLDWGLEDSVRRAHPGETGPFSWWDYRSGSFHKGWGMRIDLVLVTRALAERLVSAGVDRDARKKGPAAETQPSDHAPVVIDLADPGPPA